MTKRDKYARLLEFYDGKKFDHEETAEILDRIITIVKENGGVHQAGCAWVIALLCKYNKITTLQIEETVEQFNEYCKDYDDYIDSIVVGDKIEAQLTYYNAFLQKKKGE